MRIVLGLALLLSAAAHAAKLPPPIKMNLVPASCVVLPAGTAVRCSPMRFTSGTVVMKSLRQPKPTCPKTGEPTEAPGATFQMAGVTKDGALFDGSLPVQVNFKTAFGDDPTGNCELRNLVVPNLPSLGGTLACRKGRCKGTAYPIQCLPGQCADTEIVSEFGSVEVGGQTFGPIVVFDDAGAALATVGTMVAPGAEP
jgi:hypothetical protein